MKIKEVVAALERWAPPVYQEGYDNAGLMTGDLTWDMKGVLVTLDSTEEVVEEALNHGANLIVAHHPIIFSGLKKITGKSYVERTIIKAIKHDIAIYAIHTNLDNVHTGVNRKIADLLGLQNLQVLQPKSATLSKLVTFVPTENAEEVAEAIFEAGAGQIGNYDQCSFVVEGQGTFRPNEAANPYVGEAHMKEIVHERRLEVMFQAHLRSKVINALKKSHPYEEVAYYISQLENENQEVGSGMIGFLPEAMSSDEFLGCLKDRMQLNCVRHTALVKPTIRKVALCGGAGSFLLKRAKSQNADIFVTADYKYHEFFDADGKIIIADIGHYESERFTKDLIGDYLRQNFSNIALRLSDVNTNPINYY